jgi:hypothetical protein
VFLAAHGPLVHNPDRYCFGPVGGRGALLHWLSSGVMTWLLWLLFKPLRMLEWLTRLTESVVQSRARKRRGKSAVLERNKKCNFGSLS